MKFRTSYTGAVRTPCATGDGFEDVFAMKVDDFGNDTLEKVGKTNVYEQIQSYADSVDLHVLVARYKAGDVDALNIAESIYGDFYSAPASLLDAQRAITDMRSNFEKLPTDIKEKFDNNYNVFLACMENGTLDDVLGRKSDIEKAEAVEVPVVAPEVTE